MRSGNKTEHILFYTTLQPIIAESDLVKTWSWIKSLNDFTKILGNIVKHYGKFAHSSSSRGR